jgi:DNA-binding CsgD family transcriptional regulator
MAKAIRSFISDNKRILLYGVLLAIFVFLLKWIQWKFLIVENSIELYVGLVSVFFTVLGIWIAQQLNKPKVEYKIVEKEVLVYPTDTLDQQALEDLNLSSREYEILQLIAKGMSNGEISQHIFLSLSTVKTHVSNLFLKMEVKSRTQAIEKAKRLRIIP